MSNQDKKDLMKELNDIAHLYNLNESAEKKEEKPEEATLEKEIETISMLYNLN